MNLWPCVCKKRDDYRWKWEKMHLWLLEERRQLKQSRRGRARYLPKLFELSRLMLDVAEMVRFFTGEPSKHSKHLPTDGLVF